MLRLTIQENNTKNQLLHHALKRMASTINKHGLSYQTTVMQSRMPWLLLLCLFIFFPLPVSLLLCTKRFFHNKKKSLLKTGFNFLHLQ